MPNFKFTKMHGLGNDFVFIDLRSEKVLLSTELIRLVSDRKRGIGCDQLICIEHSDIADVKMSIFNQDGSIAGACGNASRCMVEYIGAQALKIEVAGRVLEGRIVKDGLYQVNMGGYSISPETLDVDVYAFTLVDVGNKHAILQSPDLGVASRKELTKLAKRVQELGLYNVTFILAKDASSATIETYENGVGWTQACGSAACATAAFLGKKSITIKMLGGELQVEINNSQLLMNGASKKVYKGEFIN